VTGHDLLVLEPGDTVTHAWGIQAAPKVAVSLLPR